MGRETELLQIDAFTAEPFAGNPAAVCLLPEARSDAWLQAVAAEMNLSETAFLEARGEAFGLRWFTPTVEVRLCGHATLASAHALRETGRWSGSAPVAFDTSSGRLEARLDDDWIALDFPGYATRECALPDPVRRALGLTAVAEHHVPGFHGEHDYLIELPDEAAVRAVRPDFGALRASGAQSVIVTAPGNEHDFVSRFFAPWAGIDEDPVTGAAHCALAPYWSERLGRPRLVGYQASTRGGVVDVEVRGERVVLRGQAVTVLRGSLVG
jgi:PhzF family phenazine biosynthesis protein